MDKLQEIKSTYERFDVIQSDEIDFLIQTIEQQQELIKGKSELIEQYSESKKELLAENERLKEEIARMYEVEREEMATLKHHIQVIRDNNNRTHSSIESAIVDLFR